MKCIKFKNCKFNSAELAIKFSELGNKFLDFYEANKTVLDFSSTIATQTECGTVACHGGFAALILDKESGSYIKGAKLLANYLGFTDISDYIEWSNKHSKFWDNNHGAYMFKNIGYLAFGKMGHDQVTLEDIAKHYQKVSYNLTQATYFPE